MTELRGKNFKIFMQFAQTYGKAICHFPSDYVAKFKKDLEKESMSNVGDDLPLADSASLATAAPNGPATSAIALPIYLPAFISILASQAPAPTTGECDRPESSCSSSCESDVSDVAPPHDECQQAVGGIRGSFAPMQRSLSACGSDACSARHASSSIRFMLPHMVTCNTEHVTADGKLLVPDACPIPVLAGVASGSSDASTASGQFHHDLGSSVRDGALSQSSLGVVHWANWRHPTVFRCSDSSQDKLALSFERFRSAACAPN